MFYKPKNNPIFPHPLLVDEEGIIALSESITKEDIKTAYSFGLFPWYSDYPIFWWNTNPRCVLFPDQLKVHKSMRPYFNQNKFRVSFNHDFEAVIHNCKDILREGQEGTWLNQDLIKIFSALHQDGIAQSVEVWEGDQLVGGLYGLLLGKIFFGESMFSKKPNASKFGFISMVRKLRDEGIVLIDCQQETQHLKSMGATTISKIAFWTEIKKNLFEILKSDIAIEQSQIV